MRHIDEYKHLDDGDPLLLSAEIPEVARMIVAKNYGASRMLSAMVYALRENPGPASGETHSPLADELEKILNAGFYY